MYQEQHVLAGQSSVEDLSGLESYEISSRDMAFNGSMPQGPLYEPVVRMAPDSGSKFTPKSNSQRREVGDLAVWTLSSAKHGNGVEQLRDDQTTTFWQSDGHQPHLVNIQFLKKMRIQEIAIYLDFKTDESYTP